jgi:hypothetical protein
MEERLVSAERFPQGDRSLKAVHPHQVETNPVALHQAEMNRAVPHQVALSQVVQRPEGKNQEGRLQAVHLNPEEARRYNAFLRDSSVRIKRFVVRRMKRASWGCVKFHLKDREVRHREEVREVVDHHRPEGTVDLEDLPEGMVALREWLERQAHLQRPILLSSSISDQVRILVT